MINISFKSLFMTLIKSEDWWAVWVGLFLFIVGYTGIISNVPKPTNWDVNPFSSFSLNSIISYFLLTIILVAIDRIIIRIIVNKKYEIILFLHLA